MSPKITNKGYQPLTPEELRADLLAKVKSKIPSFMELPAELQNNLLDEGTVFFVYLENYFSRLFNGFSPSQAPELLFEMLANERGLRRKGAYKSVAQVEFKGLPGTLIPIDLSVSNTAGNAVYYTSQEVVIPSTGTIVIECYSNADNVAAAANTLTEIGIDIGVTCNNPKAAEAPIAEESFQEFKKRCQARWRNPKSGSYEGLITAIKSIPGVLQRGVNFKKNRNAINLVITGGDPLQIAYAIYKYGGVTNKAFTADQSDKASVISQNLNIFGANFSYEWNAGKEVKIDISVAVNLKNSKFSNETLKIITQDGIINFVNSLIVGEPVSQLVLTEKFFEGFKAMGGNVSSIAQPSLTFIIKKHDTQEVMNFDNNGYLQAAFNEYFVLASYTAERLK